MTKTLDTLRDKWKSIYSNEKYGKWIVNAIVAIIAFYSISKLLPFAVTIKNSYLLDWIKMGNTDVETVLKFAPIIVALATLIFPGLGVFAICAIVFGAFEGISPFLITLVVIAMAMSIASGKATKALVMLLPIAAIQLTSIPISFFVLATALYATNKLDKTSRGLLIAISYGFLEMAFGKYGKIDGVTYPTNFWAADKTDFAFTTEVDSFWLSYWRQILVVAIVWAVVSVLFEIIINENRTKLVKLPVEIKDAIAWIVLAVSIAVGYSVIAIEINIPKLTLNYVSLIIQLIAAYILTRVIAYPVEPYVKKEKREKTPEEKKQRNRKLVIAGVIVAIIAGGCYYLNANYGDEVKKTLALTKITKAEPHDMSWSQYVGRWHAMGYYDYDGTYIEEDWDNYFDLNADGTVTSGYNEELAYWYDLEGTVKIVYDGGFNELYEPREGDILDCVSIAPVDENGHPVEREYNSPYVRSN